MPVRAGLSWAGLFVLVALVRVPSAAETPPKEAAPEEKKEQPQDAAKPEEKKEPPKEQEIVVTATRLPTPREATGVAVSIIRAQDLETNQDTHAAEALRMVPGVAITQLGRKGDLTEIRVRGGESDHTMVLFDGWKMNQFGRWKSFNFEGLDPLAVERLEIARGPSSALYGSEAVTGTVNVVTRKGEGRPELTASAAGGTYATDREALGVQGREGNFSYNVSGSRLHRQEATPNNSELELYNYAARFDYDISDDHALKLIVRGADFKKGWYENGAWGVGPGLAPPDPNDTIHDQNWLVGLEYSGRPVPIWQTVLRLGHAGADYRYVSRPPQSEMEFFGFPVSNDPQRQFVQERRDSFEWQNHVTVFEDRHVKDVFTLGCYIENERFSQDDVIQSLFLPPVNVYRHQVNYSGYAQNRLELYGRAFITLVGRHEEREKFGASDTGRADVALLIPESETRIHGSVGNAFRAPTFFELFFPNSGNPGLKPEQNFAWDAGVEQHFWQRRAMLGATYFENHFKNLIAFEEQPPWRMANLGGAWTRGVELEARLRPVKQITLEATATHMRTENGQTGQQLLRRPKRVYTARLVAHPLVDLVPARHDGLDLSFEWLSVSSRRDVTADASLNFYGYAVNRGYKRLDIAAGYRFLDHFRAFVRIENVLDRKYQEVLMFPADGTNVLGGLEFRWRF